MHGILPIKLINGSHSLDRLKASNISISRISAPLTKRGKSLCIVQWVISVAGQRAIMTMNIVHGASFFTEAAR